MRIEHIELRHIKMELVAPFVTSMGVETDEEHIIVRVDGEGVTGWGESVAEGTPFYSYETVQTAWHILKDFLIPGILGRDVASIEGSIRLGAKVRGHMMAKAGLEAGLRFVPIPPAVGGKAVGEEVAQLALLRRKLAGAGHRLVDADRLGLAGDGDEVELARLDGLLR